MYRQNLNQNRHKLAGLMMDLDPRRGEEMYRQALADQEHLCGQAGIDPEYRHNLAKQYHRWGEELARLKRDSEAVAALEKAIAIQGELARDYGWVPKYGRTLAMHWAKAARLLLARARDNIREGDALLWKAKQADKAVPVYRQALSILAGVAKGPHSSADVEGKYGCAHEKVAQALLRCRQPGEAEACVHFNEAIKYLKKAVATKPGHSRFKKILGDAQKTLATTQARMAKQRQKAVLAPP